MKANKEKKQKKKMTGKRLLLVVLCSLLALILLVLFGGCAYFRLPVLSYYRASEKAFRIPGLSDGLIPQGLDYDERTDLFWVGGYCTDGSASPVYLVRRSDGSLYKTLYLASPSGEDFCGHAGGLTVVGDYVYVAGGADCCLYVYSCDEMMTAEDGASVRSLGCFETGTGEDALHVSFVSFDGRYVYAGEFYRDPNYLTPSSHHKVTPSGESHQALALAYEVVADGGVFGLRSEPSFGMTLPDMVQGMCFEEERVYLSTSWGASFSRLYEYSFGHLGEPEELSLFGSVIPLYHLDSSAMTGEWKWPPMAEEIVFADGKLYTMCESASAKYQFGKLTSAQWCYATDVSELR